MASKSSSDKFEVSEVDSSVIGDENNILQENRKHIMLVPKWEFKVGVLVAKLNNDLNEIKSTITL